MGKIVISTNASVDGVIQDPDGKEGFRLGGWFNESGGDDLAAWAELDTTRRCGAAPCCWAGAATSGSPRDGSAARARGRRG